MSEKDVTVVSIPRIGLVLTEIRWPPRCACCNGSLDSFAKSIIAGASDRAMQLSYNFHVPYCQRCFKHVRLRVRVITFIVLSAIAAFIALCILSNKYQERENLVILMWGAAVVGGFLGGGLLYAYPADKRASAKMGCTSFGPAVTVKSVVRDSVHFEFKNRAFGEEFKRINDELRYGGIPHS